MPARPRLGGLFILVILFGALTSSLRAQQRGPSTPEERARAVNTAHALQTDPLSPDLQPDREWLIKWLIEVPDISVPLCSTVLGDLGDAKGPYPSAVIGAEMASEAAFVIEHPDKAKDPASVYFAGADGALNAYQAIRKKDPKYQVARLDDMTQKREQGKLADYVRDAAKKCKK